jgi:hypothetical protein
MSPFRSPHSFTRMSLLRGVIIVVARLLRPSRVLSWRRVLPLESGNVPLVVVGRGGHNVFVLGALPPSRDSDGGEDTTLPTRHR